MVEGVVVMIRVSRTVCYRCGLRFDATIHGSDTWWQHTYVPGILTRVT